MSSLKVSVSGIRGIWGDGLDLDTLYGFTKAFAYYIKSKGGKSVLLGRDARPTGKTISLYISGILNALGIDVADCGIVPTPTVLFGVRRNGFDGGIIITASHNPIEWNALKFVGKGGLFVSESDIGLILSYKGNDAVLSSYDGTGSYDVNSDIEEMHIKAILDKVSVSAIREKSFRVVLDPVNSAGSRIGAELLARLGCEVRVVNGEMDGKFGRGSEPVPDNLRHMTEIVRNFHADAGFALDPDADRLVVIDEKGDVLSEESTLALAVEHVLSIKRGDIVINLSTSMVNEWLAGKYGVNCFRTKVGEANVSMGIQKYNAAIGGEGNGGVIYPGINLARDSLVGMALILEMAAMRKKTISEIAGAFPRYFMSKGKFETTADSNLIFDKIKKAYGNAGLNEDDGLRLDWEENGRKVWLHVRSSNTEPVIRVIGESDSEELLRKSLSGVKEIIGRASF